MFEPFDVAFSELAAQDLAVLQEVSEGWFVEYKGEMPSAKAVAKSVASFANHHGGWLFVGVVERGDGDSRAGTFPGVSTSTRDKVAMSFRDAVTQHLAPCPYFETRFLEGPSQQIGLGADRFVLVVRVPAGNQAPFVHSSGKIYRRLADRSDPVAETDPAVLDQLWRRREARDRRLEGLVSRDLAVSAGYEKVPLVHLHVLTSLEDDEPVSELTLARFMEICAPADHRTGGLPFDSFQAHSRGFVARQVGDNLRSGVVFTLMFHHSLRSHFLIPLTFAGTVARGRVSTPGVWKEFQRVCVEQGLDGTPFVDVSALLVAFTGALRQHRSVVAEDGVSGPFYVKVRVVNCGWTVPFLNAPSFVEFVRERGVPVIHEPTFVVPAGGPSSFLRLAPIELAGLDGQDSDRLSVNDFSDIYRLTLEGFGIPREFVDANFGAIFEALIKAGYIDTD